MRWLAPQRLLHINMLENLRMDRAKVLGLRADGVLLQVDDMHMLSAKNADTALEMMRTADDLHMFALHQAAFMPLLERELGLRVTMRCHQVAYWGEPFALPDRGIEMRPLGPEWLDFVMAHYKHADDRAYIETRFTLGVMVGAFMGKTMIGFAGEHREGTMGLLEVLPDWQRQGVGAYISKWLCNRYISQGRVPHAQVEEGNEASLALHRALGFEIGTEIVVWGA